jgi:hypothetical protein
MSTIGSHPGAIVFRLSIMIILIVTLVSIFFSYLEDTEREFERTSILQTKKIIDSSLAVVFATYAVNNRLNELNDLDGGNPFVHLAEYGILPTAYVGEIDHDPVEDQQPGWYYLSHRKILIYKSLFSDADRYFTIVLNYQDDNESGSFESASDKFQSLQFVKITELERDH